MVHSHHRCQSEPSSLPSLVRCGHSNSMHPHWPPHSLGHILDAHKDSRRDERGIPSLSCNACASPKRLSVREEAPEFIWAGEGDGDAQPKSWRGCLWGVDPLNTGHSRGVGANEPRQELILNQIRSTEGTEGRGRERGNPSQLGAHHGGASARI